MNAPTWFGCQLVLAAFCTSLLATQPPPDDDQPKRPDNKKEFGGTDFPKKDFMKKGPGGFGPGGFGGGPFGQQRKLVARFDKDGDGRLNNEERKAARAEIKKEGPRGMFGLGGPKGPGGRGPMLFGPGAFLTRPLLEAVDADGDEKLTHEELGAGIKKFVVVTLKGKADALDEEQLAEALGALIPRPQGFPGGFDGPFPNEARKKDGPRGFGGFNPGMPLAHAILERADANADEKATTAELTAAAAKLFKAADKNNDAKLDEAELGAAIGELFPPPPGFGPPGGPGAPGGPRGPGAPGGPGFGPPGKGGRDPAKPGVRVTPDEVKHHPDAPLYDPAVLRTLFLEFENEDWEAELAEFKGSDVEVPATLVVDGKKYPNVGVHFRGMSSFGMVPAGYKRSLNLALDFVDEKQRLYGYKTLNLLNANGDASLLSTALYSHIARKFIPAPKSNLVKVVINGENWGVYANVQQFNKEFLVENFPDASKGTRWKVKGSPGGDGGLSYVGENIDEYKRRYQIKSDDNEKAWKALIALCRTLDKTPPDQLEKALAPMLDIDGALKFLALDVVLSNSDGYWTRASDYYLFRDAQGKFHVMPHDMNEAFQPGMGGFGPGFGKGKGFGKGFDKDPKDGFGPKGEREEDRKKDFGKGAGPRTNSFGPDPLVGLDEARKPLRSRLLAVPSLRQRYLGYVRAVAEELDWHKLGPVVTQYRELVEKEVAVETRKLMTLAAFQTAVADEPAEAGPGGRALPGLRAFAEGRRNYILNHPAVKEAAANETENSKEATR
jgi:hypothetical protein